ncbi:MAG: LuxR C-terminal-related transcriptional regulator [Halopseudomonas sp.]
MIRALITGHQPLYRLAVADLLEQHGGLCWAESRDPLTQQGRVLEKLGLLVICAGADDEYLIRQLGQSSRLTQGKIVLFSEYLGKRHQKLIELEKIDLCLPLSITLTQAQHCLDELLSAGPSHSVGRMQIGSEIQNRFYPDLRDLTQCERKVLFKLQKGLNNQAIADCLDISINTVKVHLSHVCRKVGFRNRYQAAGFTSAQLTVDHTLMQGLY